MTQATAPGGDSVFGRTPEAPNGRVLSTWPPDKACTRSVHESYGNGQVNEFSAVTHTTG